tara:strand:- start:78 stop:968 length:891 start_codon:yes stop_codon:yes gene_type:complete
MISLKKLTKKKVAILGASLPMLLFAYYLKKKKIDVMVINNSRDLGGAWQNFKYRDLQIRKQSNIILPGNKIEEKNQTKINNFLKKEFFVKIIKIKEDINIIYKVKNVFSYNFDIFLKKFIKEKILKKILVSKIEIKNNIVEINNKYKFDLVYLPTYFGIEKIKINNKLYKTNFKVIKSEHVVAIIKNQKIKNFHYSDFFNNFFDRAQFINHKSFSSFSARIVKEKKNATRKDIYESLQKIFNKKSILNFYKFKYKNFYRNKDNVENLRKLEKFKQIEQVNTSSFTSSMLKLISYDS